MVLPPIAQLLCKLPNSFCPQTQTLKVDDIISSGVWCIQPFQAIVHSDLIENSWQWCKHKSCCFRPSPGSPWASATNSPHLTYRITLTEFPLMILRFWCRKEIFPNRIRQYMSFTLLYIVILIKTVRIRALAGSQSVRLYPTYVPFLCRNCLVQTG